MKGDQMGHDKRRGLGVPLVALLLSITAVGLTSGTAGAAAVRGFDGKTISIGGIWAPQNFSGAQTGAQAYINQVNKTNYLHGIKL